MTADGRLAGHEIGRVVYDADQIRDRVEVLGAEITVAYPEDEGLLVIGLLKGSFLFMADLVRAIRRPLQVDFLVASSYGDEKVSSGDVRLLYDPAASMRGRHVLIVEDIVDSGTTLSRLAPRLRAREPLTVEVCALLHKRLVDLDPPARWVGFDAPNEFLVGYGLDHAENFRHLPYVASL